jgi:ADP-ribose pyrophosphatase
MFKIIKEKKVFNDKLIIEEGTLMDDSNKKFTKLRLNREDASAVLIVNTESNNVVLTKQFRYAISAKTSKHILEIVAGKIDKDEKPLKTAIREAEEETGYKIKPKNIKLLAKCFVTPGYSSERFYIYYAHVTNSDKVSKGGGLQSENEQIEVVELSFNDFKNRIEETRIDDAKTYIAGLLYNSLNH